MKSEISLIFIAILLGGIALSVSLVAEPISEQESKSTSQPNYYETPTGLAYGTPEIVAEKYGILISELKPGEPPSAPAMGNANYVQVVSKIGGN